MPRVLLLVLDGTGVGALPEWAALRPSDAGANTLGHLAQRLGPLELPALASLGLGALAPGCLQSNGALRGAFTTADLAHRGPPDSYSGHNEIVGSRPAQAQPTMWRDVADEMAAALGSAGFHVQTVDTSAPALLIDGAMVAGDNLEAEPGAIFNVTAALGRVEPDRVLAAARVIRERVATSRVIALGNPGLTIERILAATAFNDRGQHGVRSPEARMYDHRYWVRHLGHGIDPEGQAPLLAQRAGLPVTLLGKMADVVDCPGAAAQPGAGTDWVMHSLAQAMTDQPHGLIAATVQETDLAGHEGDHVKFARALGTVDRALHKLLDSLRPADLLIVCADHGNDPQVNPGQHTHERVPVLLAGPSVAPGRLPPRMTAADIGATITRWLGLPATEFGTPMLSPPESAR
jgi:phosphopentomutase